MRDIARMRRLLPEEWLPDATVHRVILHWTAGGYLPSGIDSEHYHFLIAGSGQVTRGVKSVGQWPAHTRGLNTGSIGVALCGMMNAVEGQDPGPHPLVQAQIDTLDRVVADLVDRYNLDVQPHSVLCHRDVGAEYGIRQHGKWDIGWWPGMQGDGKNFAHLLRARLLHVAP